MSLDPDWFQGIVVGGLVMIIFAILGLNERLSIISRQLEAILKILRPDRWDD